MNNEFEYQMDKKKKPRAVPWEKIGRVRTNNHPLNNQRHPQPKPRRMKKENGSCSLNGKLFIVARQCEVYDTTANRFCVLRSPFSFSEPELVFNRHELFVFDNNSAVYCYNPHDERWCKKGLQNVNQPTKFCCGLVSLT